MKPYAIAAAAFCLGIAGAVICTAWIPVVQRDCVVEVTRQLPVVVKYTKKGRIGRVELRTEVVEFVGSRRLDVRHGDVCALRIGRDG